VWFYYTLPRSRVQNSGFIKTPDVSFDIDPNVVRAPHM
jgi:hypothetical protein